MFGKKIPLVTSPTSFSAFLGVKGNRYPLLGYDLSIHQETDSLGRPASPTLGGTIDCVLSSPGSDQPFLHQWMFSPTMQEDGKLVLMQDSPRATLKTISFFNAYCTGLQTNFVPGDTGGGSLQMQVRISPQRIAVGAIIHDNNWPLVSHGAGETFAEIPVTPIAKGKAKADEEPGLFSDIAHTVLDVAGLVPVIGELADGANALYYLAEGNKTDAALSAAAMIPIAGWAATGGKLLRKGLKIAAKAKAVKKASDKVTKGAKAVKAAAKRKAVNVTGELLSGELKTGTYRDLVKLGKRGDNLTPHHIPSDAYMRQKGGTDYTRDKGVSIMVEQPSPRKGGRHRNTKTYGGNMTDAQRDAYYKMTPDEALKHDVDDLRKIYKDQGLLDDKVKNALNEVIQLNKNNYPNIFN